MSRAELAKALDVSRQTLYQIMHARQRVTARMAVRLARAFCTSPESWLQMQAITICGWRGALWMCPHSDV